MGFQSSEAIKLQPNDSKLVYKFNFPVCSSSSANDGTLPYGTTISGIAVTSWNGSTQIEDLIYGTPSVQSTVATVQLSYPSTTMSGVSGKIYPKLRFVMTLSDGSTLEDDFDNIVVGD